MLRVAVVIVVSIFGFSSANAYVTFCNKFGHPVYVAWAFQRAETWVSQGWLKVDTGECQPSGLDVPMFYFRGETDWYKVKGGKQEMNAWEADVSFAVDNGSFEFTNSDKEITGKRFDAFIKSAESSDGPISETVTFEKDGTHETQETHPR